MAGEEFGRKDAVGGTPTAAVETTAIPKQRDSVGESPMETTKWFEPDISCPLNGLVVLPRNRGGLGVWGFIFCFDCGTIYAMERTCTWTIMG